MRITNKSSLDKTNTIIYLYVTRKLLEIEKNFYKKKPRYSLRVTSTVRSEPDGRTRQNLIYLYRDTVLAHLI